MWQHLHNWIRATFRSRQNALDQALAQQVTTRQKTIEDFTGQLRTVLEAKEKDLPE